MPFPPRKPRLADRVVKHVLRDGTETEYRYPRKKPPAIHRAADSISALIAAYQNSPEWRALAPSTRQNYAIYLMPLDKAGHLSVSSLKRRDILSLRDGISAGRGSGAATVFVRVVAALLAWAVDREWIDHNPAARIKALPGGHLRAWTVDEADAAQRDLPPHLARAVILARYTGQRRGDLCAMGWSAYDGATIRLVQEKTKQPLVIPAHPILRAELDAWPRQAATILTNKKGVPWKPIYLSHQLPDALERIGLSGELGIHGLRKLAAAELANAGCSVHEIAAITGHRTLAMVQHYTASADQIRMADAAIIRLSQHRDKSKKRQ